MDNLLKFKEEIKAKTVESILRVQPINYATKIGTNDKNQNFANRNFNQVYKTMIENNARVNNQFESNEKRLCDKVNYYGMDAKATYYCMNESQNNYYS